MPKIDVNEELFFKTLGRGSKRMPWWSFFPWQRRNWTTGRG